MYLQMKYFSTPVGANCFYKILSNKPKNPCLEWIERFSRKINNVSLTLQTSQKCYTHVGYNVANKSLPCAMHSKPCTVAISSQLEKVDALLGLQKQNSKSSLNHFLFLTRSAPYLGIKSRVRECFPGTLNAKMFISAIVSYSFFTIIRVWLIDQMNTLNQIFAV